jgi:hypothetical protein
MHMPSLGAASISMLENLAERAGAGWLGYPSASPAVAAFSATRVTPTLKERRTPIDAGAQVCGAYNMYQMYQVW